MGEEPAREPAERFGRLGRGWRGRAPDGCQPGQGRLGHARFGGRHAMTERQLLDRFIAQNDHEAFKSLVEQHGPMVLSVCRSILLRQHDVEDAFQTTFLILARRASTIKHLETVGPWLHRVALRVARKRG